MSANQFVAELSNLAFEHTFNPYSDCCEVYDLANATQCRRDALVAMLKCATSVEVDSLWIGRDLGHRGGRRTGLALTDDLHLTDHLDRWGVSAKKITKGQAVGERTAAIIWQVLSRIVVPTFLWNVFPLHPHVPGDPFSNRLHNAKERLVGEAILRELGRLLKPNRVIAIGNDAERSAIRIFNATKVIKVRHPSYGGQKDFIRQIESCYKFG